MLGQEYRQRLNAAREESLGDSALLSAAKIWASSTQIREVH
jgi:hypothetical protein